MRRSSGLLFGGALLLLMGLVGVASPLFVTQPTRDVVRIGDLKVQTMEERVPIIPLELSRGSVVLGMLLLGAGCYSGREHTRRRL